VGATGDHHETFQCLQGKGLLPDSVPDFSGGIGARENFSSFRDFLHTGSQRHDGSPEARRKRARQVDREPSVPFEKRFKTSCVVPVNMGENDKVDFRRLNPESPHVPEQGIPVAACIEENGLFKPLNQTGKPPGRLQARVEPVVVVENGQSCFHRFS